MTSFVLHTPRRFLNTHPNVLIDDDVNLSIAGGTYILYGGISDVDDENVTIHYHGYYRKSDDEVYPNQMRVTVSKTQFYQSFTYVEDSWDNDI